jgi:hypothetical protein
VELVKCLPAEEGAICRLCPLLSRALSSWAMPLELIAQVQGASSGLSTAPCSSPQDWTVSVLCVNTAGFAKPLLTAPTAHPGASCMATHPAGVLAPKDILTLLPRCPLPIGLSLWGLGSLTSSRGYSKLR